MATSEQAANSHDEAVANIEKMFGGGEDTAEEQVETPPETEGEPAEAETQEAEGAEQEETPSQPEEVEVEIDGERYLVPKKISDRFIQHADYTRKTQDVAELRRSLSAEREAAVVEKAFSDAVAAERKQLDIFDAQLAQFKAVDWNALDTEQIVRLGRQRDQLREAKDELEGQIKAKRADFDGKLKALGQQAIEAGQKYVEQKIKGFDDGQKKELFAYGLNEGYTRDELDRLVDPRIIVTLWKARQWDSLQASKPELTKKAANAAPVVRPGATKQGPNRIQQLDKRFKETKSAPGKKQAAEDYFTAKFGG